MDTNDALRARFDAIDAAEVEAMIARKQPEGLELDFKQYSNDTDNLKNVKKCLSGFANSAGGIILWGIDTKSQSGGGSNLASGIVPINDGEAAVNRLYAMSSGATHRPVDGVVHKAIALPTGGYVVKTLVPQSDTAPHRTADQSGQYYRRGADRFEPMYHHEIEALFGRRPRPWLAVTVPLIEPCFDRAGGFRQHVSIVVAIENQGTGLAHFPALQLAITTRDLDIDVFGLNGDRDAGLRRQLRRTGDPCLPHLFTSYGDVLVHPGQQLEVTRLKWKPVEAVSQPDLSFGYTTFAEGMKPNSGLYTITSAQIETAWAKRAGAPGNQTTT